MQFLTGTTLKKIKTNKQTKNENDRKQNTMFHFQFLEEYKMNFLRVTWLSLVKGTFYHKPF